MVQSDTWYNRQKVQCFVKPDKRSKRQKVLSDKMFKIYSVFFFGAVAFWGGGLLGWWPFGAFYYVGGLLGWWPFEVVAFWGGGLLGSGLLGWWPFELWPFGVAPSMEPSLRPTPATLQPVTSAIGFSCSIKISLRTHNIY